MVIWAEYSSGVRLLCVSFNIYPVRRLYPTLLRFPHLILVYRGLLCGVDVCWSSLDTHWSFMWLSVLLFQSEPCPSWTCHTPSGEVPPRFCVLFGYFFLRRLSSLSDTVPYFEFNAFLRHLKKKTIFASFSVCMYICSCSVCRVLSSFCLCYYSALLYSSCILCIPYSGPITSITITIHYVTIPQILL